MAILEVGARRLCDDVDLIVMSGLVERGFMAVRSADRRLVLTERGRRAYEELRVGRGSRWTSFR
jgi:hypothetical protein